MRYRHTNPFELTDEGAEKIVAWAATHGSLEYTGPKRYSQIIKLGLHTIPGDWKVLFVDSKESKTHIKMRGETGMTLPYYKIIIVLNAETDRAVVSLFREIYHARKMEELGFEQYHIGEYNVWSELDADLYSLLVLYRSPESPWRTIKDLLYEFLPSVIAYGVAYAAANMKGVIAMPTRWKFLVHLINEAVMNPKIFFAKYIKLSARDLPDDIYAKYASLITSRERFILWSRNLG